MVRFSFNVTGRLAGLALGGLVAAAPLSSGASDAREVYADTAATALMRRVAATYSHDVTGVVAVRSHSELTIAAPVFRRHIVDDGWFVFADGVLAATSHKSDPRQPPLHDPYRERYLGEYTFHSVACTTCAPGSSAIAYESEAHDVAHAHGTLVVDEATARITSSSETPYKLPWPTKSGSLDARWGDAKGGWFPLEIDGAFVGNIGPFVGHARYAQVLSAYDRYPTVATAVATLTNQTGLSAAAFSTDNAIRTHACGKTSPNYKRSSATSYASDRAIGGDRTDCRDAGEFRR